jgi:hypothetical protein
VKIGWHNDKHFHEPASQLAKLHAKLDDLTLKAYSDRPTDDLLAVLLALNLECDRSTISTHPGF